jgi:hypothetical protein
MKKKEFNLNYYVKISNSNLILKRTLPSLPKNILDEGKDTVN